VRPRIAGNIYSEISQALRRTSDNLDVGFEGDDDDRHLSIYDDDDEAKFEKRQRRREKRIEHFGYTARGKKNSRVSRIQSFQMSK
jgi:hypothetical protein